MAFTKSFSKKQVAQMLDVSPSTLSRYLNQRYFSQLQQLGYCKEDKLLSPKIMNWLQDKLGLEYDNTLKLF